MTRMGYAVTFAYQALGWIIFAAESPSKHGEIHLFGPDALGVGGAIVIVVYAIWHAKRTASRVALIYVVLTTVSVTLANFADIYLLSGWQHWTAHVHHRTALAMAVGTLSTSGLPGIDPATDFARGLVAWQQLVDLVLATVLIALVAHRLGRTAERATPPV